MRNEVKTTTTTEKMPVRTHHPFMDLQKRMDELFNDFSIGYTWPDIFAGSRADVVPSMDVRNAKDKVLVTAELPGVMEKDIDIDVDHDMLTISGEKLTETESKEDEWVRSERSYGSFSRTVRLPFEINPEHVSAKFEHGVLTVEVKRPVEKVRTSKKIPIAGTVKH
ncbi:MAG: Hsp20/alpha crystallin family protein [Hyphomicrobiaceae bacterium]|nr:Hsp20/alpha crystallin family protein [Hyphomicrobiaceae bacterium]